MVKTEIVESKTQQLTLLDFNQIAEEIKTLTQEIIKNRWQISDKLFYIKENWDEYKKQDDFPYKTFQQFIKHYYGWTKKEAYNYIDAHKLKLLLVEKSVASYTLDDVGITNADLLYQLSKIDEEKAIEIVEENPNITRKEVEETIKKTKREQKAKEGKNINIEDLEIDLRLGDFIKVLDDIPDGSVDLILTDPPYPIEFIDCWSKLADFAFRKLKKNGFCIAYCGHKNLSESMKRMELLDFYWIFSLIHSGNTKLIAFNNICAGWKPILVYQKGFKKLDDRVDDVIQGSGRSKKDHDWQQGLDELDYLIDKFSKPGDVIVEPFAGSGTTLISIKKNNRIGIGAEENEDTYNIAKKRISDSFE